MKILVIGATSLVGSHLVEALAGKGVVACGRRDPDDLGVSVERFIPADLSDKAAITSAIEESGCEAIVNFAARTDVDGCERERPANLSDKGKLGKAGSAWTTNALLPGWIAEEVERRRLTLVHLSTDFIFAGEDGPYPESALPDPFAPKVSWYGYTKGVGEAMVLSHARERSAILRISYPYRSSFQTKTDLARNILSKARDGVLPPLYTDQLITPTWIPDISKAIQAILRLKSTGTFHVASPLATTPYAFAVTLLAEVGLKSIPLTSTLLQGQVALGRAPRPLIGGLSVSRIRSLGIQPLSYREGLAALAKEITPS